MLTHEREKYIKENEDKYRKLGYFFVWKKTATESDYCIIFMPMNSDIKAMYAETWEQAFYAVEAHYKLTTRLSKYEDLAQILTQVVTDISTEE